MEHERIEEIIENLFSSPVETEGLETDSSSGSLEPVHGPQRQKLLNEAEYFLDILACGYKAGMNPDGAIGCTFRTRRLDLGIDLPELDVVCQWTTRDGDRISIPFVEFLAFQAADRLRLVAPAGASVEGAGDSRHHAYKIELEERFRELLRQLPDDKLNRDYPVLGDRFLPPNVLKSWCSENGALRRILGMCKSAQGMETSS